MENSQDSGKHFIKLHRKLFTDKKQFLKKQAKILIEKEE